MWQKISNKISLWALLLVVVATGALLGFMPFNAEANNSYKNNTHAVALNYGNPPYGNAFGQRYRYQSTSNTQSLQEYIQYLIQLLRQLEALQRGGYSYNDSFVRGNAEIDITTRSAEDIDEDSAVLRGIVDFNRSDEATVWFEWGASSRNLNKTTSKVTLDDDDDEDFERRITGLDEGDRYYYRAVGEDEDGRRDYGAIAHFVADEDGRNGRNDDDPDPVTEDADDVEDTSAELNGSVDMNDFDDGRVFFVYGEDEDQVDDIADDYDTYNEIDEDGDDLQKILVDSSLDGKSSYRADIFGLDEDTDMFFTICVEYEDEDDDDTILCGDTEEFTTGDDDGNSNDDEPEVETEDAEEITEDSAELNGFIDMNDFENGRAFFVYGEDEDQVEDVEDDFDTYSDVDEDGDDLQKILVDSDVDGSVSYSADIFGLDEDTDYFFAMCLEYEDEDDDDVLVCGIVESFTTDED